MLIINSYDIITFTGVTQCIHKHPHLVLGQDQHLTKLRVRNPTEYLISTILYYRIARKFGGLAVYITTAKLKSAKISYSHAYVWRSHTEPSPPIFLQ